MSDMTCADVMSATVYTLAPDEPVCDAAGKLLRQRVSGCPVVDDGVVVGVISELDLLRALHPSTEGEAAQGTVAEHMTPTPIGLRPSADLMEAAHFFFEYPVRRVPVIDEQGELRGVLARRDVLRVMAEIARRRRAAGR